MVFGLSLGTEHLNVRPSFSVRGFSRYSSLFPLVLKVFVSTSPSLRAYHTAVTSCANTGSSVTEGPSYCSTVESVLAHI